MADSKTAIALTLVHEGGFTKDEQDSGNWTGGKIGVGELKGTKYGISAAQFPNEDIENMTTDRATQIYEAKYWFTSYNGIQIQQVANSLFDIGVPAGPGSVAKVLQGVLGLPTDGIIGPATVAGINAGGVGVVQLFKTALVSHFISVANADPNKRKYLSGWIKRVNCPNCGFKHV